MNTQEVEKQAFSNYNDSNPWPENDRWHACTYNILNRYISRWLAENTGERQTILSAGSGNTEYHTKATVIYMDIIESYVMKFEHHIVGSVENIPLADKSVDAVLCVGSVLNYTEAEKSISEFRRVLKPGGTLVLEFERSNSAEFLFRKIHGKKCFQQEYLYNHQKHLLWMYDENYIRQLLGKNSFHTQKTYRYHILSTLIYRFGMKEEKAAPLSAFDPALQLLSYPFAHNVILTARRS